MTATNTRLTCANRQRREAVGGCAGVGAGVGVTSVPFCCDLHFVINCRIVSTPIAAHTPIAACALPDDYAMSWPKLNMQSPAITGSLKAARRSELYPALADGE